MTLELFKEIFNRNQSVTDWELALTEFPQFFIVISNAKYFYRQHSKQMTRTNPPSLKRTLNLISEILGPFVESDEALFAFSASQAANAKATKHSILRQSDLLRSWHSSSCDKRNQQTFNLLVNERQLFAMSKNKNIDFLFEVGRFSYKHPIRFSRIIFSAFYLKMTGYARSV
jgi:hypothetical protein